mmetsp:Transcript_41105/g.114258  ORF Transcript_41105/g.114258 Transcript_41105/m.114258 type:complete len:324 (-) Transcript_41105:67-1038(-)
MAAAQHQPLAPGKCEQCRKPLDADRFALWYDHGKKRRSCEHLVCGPCRGIMGSWPRQECPNSSCKKPFYAIHDALSPDTTSIEDFFNFVNYTRTGRITKKELADWYTTNFAMTREDAMSAINDNWQFWDVPKNHSFLGAFRSKDQGDLDVDEFLPVQESMGESLARSLALAAAATSAPPAPPIPAGQAAASADPSEPRGQKRPHPEADAFATGVLRSVARKKLVESEELQRMLSSNATKGREWFDHFDFNKSGELEKSELKTALLQTLMGSHRMTRETITSIIDGIWDVVDRDGSGSVHFNEFQMLREAVMAQLNHDTVRTTG